jgi:NAD(P)-dependent dehydrogenase (short-subunit alcohol dehydrogenase family)
MKTVLITGANCGLGFYCAKTILATSPTYHVIVASRDESRAAAAISRLKSETGNPNVSFLQIDLASLSSVRSAASRLGDVSLSALILNAGIGPGASNGTERSVDGFEKIWATNHLGHFAFANLIRDRLTADCHIVNVSSNLHDIPAKRTNGIPISYPGAAALAEPDPEVRIPVLRYAESKLCNLYFTYELVRRLAGTQRRANAFNPGLMLDSEFHKRPMPDIPGTVSCVDMGRELAELAIAERWKDANGRYVNRGVDEPSSELSHNVENARELWEVSTRLAGLESTF